MSILNSKFIQYRDIPKNGLLYKRLYVVYPLYVIDRLYRICIEELQNKPIDLSIIDIPWKTTKEALKKFSMYNIVNDVHNIVVNNSVNCEYTPSKIYTNATDYINRVSNKYFSKRDTQYDCSTVLTAVKGEIFNFYSSLGLDSSITYFYDMKIMSKDNSNIILTEKGKLQQLKAEFKEVYDIIKDMVYMLQTQMIDKPAVNIDDVEL